MIKRTKDAVPDISKRIKEALEYNLNIADGETPIKLSSIEISRGLMNLINKDESFMADVYSSLSLSYGDGFSWRTQDNEDMGCFLYINYK